MAVSAVCAVETHPLKMQHRVTMADYTTHWMENKLDHFSEDDTRTYKQRYWFNDKYYDKDA